jgi:hypothetical protein
MADWATAATVALPAAITGAVGFGVAWLQARSKNAELSTDLTKLKLESDVKLQERREDAYRELLNAERRLQFILTASASLSEAEFTEVYTKEFIDRYNAALLIGSDTVRSSVALVASGYANVMQAGDNRRDDIGWEDAIREALHGHADEMRDARNTLITAMRKDTDRR